MPGSRLSRSLATRSSPHGGSELRARRRPGARRDAAHRHKTRSVFERYNIVSDGDLRDAARRLNEQSPRKAVTV